MSEFSDALATFYAALEKAYHGGDGIAHDFVRAHALFGFPNEKIGTEEAADFPDRSLACTALALAIRSARAMPPTAPNDIISRAHSFYAFLSGAPQWHADAIARGQIP